MPATVVLRYDPVAAQAFLRSSDGITSRLMVAASGVQAAARVLLKPGFPRNFLGPTIVKRPLVTSAGPVVMVGSEKTRTAPHKITAHDRPDGRPGMLVFPGRRGGLVFVHSVNHPGSNFDRYLADVLLKALIATHVG